MRYKKKYGKRNGKSKYGVRGRGKSKRLTRYGVSRGGVRL